MKNLIKKITGIGLILFFALTISAQEDYKTQMSSGKIIIHEVDKMDIEGYNGSEVIIQYTSKRKTKKDERAAGLRVINGTGTVDNTGIGLSVIKKGNTMTIEQVSKKSDGRFKMKVPQGVTLLYEHSNHEGRDLNIRNFTNEIEVSAHHNNVRLMNITGPMSVNTVHGDVDAEFSSVSQSNPVTIRSSHGLIDVSMPASTKANVKMRASYGDMFTDFDIKTDQKAKEKDDCNNCDSKSRISGTINGGGVLVDLHSSHGNIYVRKQQK